MASTETCAFCLIIGGERECHLVFEDEISVAFLDRRPLFPGHCLLVPREHHETISDIPPDLIAPLFSNVRLMAGAVEQGMEAEGCFIAINNRISQSVPHMHVHIVPRRMGDGLKGFFWPRHPYVDGEEVLRTRDRIRAAVERIRRV